VASALVHGSVRLAAYDPDRLRDPQTRALMDRVTVVVDPKIDAAFPGQRASSIEITMTDGRRFEHLQANRKGDPEEPLTAAELHDKFRELSSPVIGMDRARTLLARLCSLESATELDW
jgi:2-methylcitrate dehydratase PrpD